MKNLIIKPYAYTAPVQSSLFYVSELESTEATDVQLFSQAHLVYGDTTNFTKISVAESPARSSSFYTDEQRSLFRFLIESFVIAQGEFFEVAGLISRIGIEQGDLHDYVENAKKYFNLEESYIEVLNDYEDGDTTLCLTFKVMGSVEEIAQNYSDYYKNYLVNNTYRKQVSIDIV